MSNDALSPEECYQRALKSIEDGQLARAIKLLKIATLRDPSDTRFRDALHQATQAQQQPQRQAAEIDPHVLLKQAREHMAAGEAETAGKLLQIARARAPQDRDIRAAWEELRTRTDAPKTKKAAEDKAIKDITDAATEELTAGPSIAARVLTPSNNRRAALLAGVLVLLSIIGGTSFWLSRTVRAADPTPYASVLPVQKARSVGVNSEEVVLVVAASYWATQDRASRTQKLRAALSQAIQQGHTAVFIYSEADTLLGSATPETTYLP
jgi:hypothetical protein